jgi:hypothetical protein
MAVSSTPSATRSIAQGLVQALQLQQAQRNAERTQAEARALQDEAAAAQRHADRADQQARSIGQEAQRAQSAANSADRNLTSVRALTDTQKQLTQLSQSLHPAVQAPQPPPVVNAQGQLTGTVVNVKA